MRHIQPAISVIVAAFCLASAAWQAAVADDTGRWDIMLPSIAYSIAAAVFNLWAARRGRRLWDEP